MTAPVSDWGTAVATPRPEAVANQPVLGRGPGTITLGPISPAGAAFGVDYRYEMPHCGLNSPIDVDGTFWDAAPGFEVPGMDGATGMFRVVTATTATFTADDGRSVDLVRHQGAKEFGLCD